MGCRSENIFVNCVRNAMPTIIAGRCPRRSLFSLTGRPEHRPLTLFRGKQEAVGSFPVCDPLSEMLGPDQHFDVCQ